MKEMKVYKSKSKLLSI